MRQDKQKASLYCWMQKHFKTTNENLNWGQLDMELETWNYRKPETSKRLERYTWDDEQRYAEITQMICRGTEVNTHSTHRGKRGNATQQGDTADTNQTRRDQEEAKQITLT